MKMSDKEIADNINEIRLEKALAAELEKTSQIIKRTGIFDPVDNIYGEADAEYSETPEGEGGPEGLGGGGGAPMGGGADFGSDLDMMGEPGGDETGDIGGETESVDMNSAPEADSGEVAMESIKKEKPLLVESNMFTSYLEEMKKKQNKLKHIVEHQKADIYSQNFFINEELNHLISELDTFTESAEQKELTDIINETEE